jgi:hypothetical protein
MRNDRLGAVERPAQIDRDDPVPLGDRHRRDRLPGDRPGGIDQDVDPARLRRDLRNEPREGRAVGNIERMADRAAAYLGGDLRRGVAVAVDHRDPRAGLGEGTAARGADSIAAAGDEHDLASQIRGHPLLPAIAAAAFRPV